MPGSSDVAITVNLNAASQASASARLDPVLLRALMAYGWDSLSVFACASSFVLMFYLREEFQKNGKYGYVEQNLLEAAISILAALPFAVQSRRTRGDDWRAAFRHVLRYVPIYFPLNALFQIVKDWLAAAAVSHSPVDVNLVPYTNGPAEPVEMLGGMGVYGIGFSGIYAGMSWVMQLPLTMPDVAKAGLQYTVSYLIGAAFNTDLSSGTEHLPDVAYTGLTLSAMTFTFDVLSNADMRQAMKAAVCERTRPSDDKAELMLVAASDDAPPRPLSRCQRCTSWLLTTLCFWRQSLPDDPVEAPAPSSAPVSPVARVLA